jgi:hypothetical protein
MTTRSALWRTLVATVVAVLAGTLMSAPAAQAAPLYYQIKNGDHGLCLDGNTGNNNPVYVWGCVGAVNQRWTFEFVGNEGYARIRNAKTQLCLRVQGGVHYNAPLINGPCGNTWDAWWKGIDMVDGGSVDYYKLTPYYLRGQYCINAPNGVNGTAVGIEGCFAVPYPRYTNRWTWSRVA